MCGNCGCRSLHMPACPVAFQEAFAAKAFANNYSRPVIGWPDDFQQLGRREVPPKTHMRRNIFLLATHYSMQQ